jgi:hypothetical protein
MTELLTFDEDMWASIMNMLQSQDKESRELALGMVESIDYNNQEQMEVFEEKMNSSMTSPHLGTEQKGKLIHHYFLALSKQNGNIE